ncbi:hypothetical protein GCM10009564_48130 [Streptomyces thermogriseus]|uniref:Uncharacterized protein n=1 Tax=Streptomyces thermogriseus TaxID=75292 RepID=A0ABN1T5F7_9ACTN
MRKAAAIWDRPALWTQTNSTGGTAAVSGTGEIFTRRGDGGSGEAAADVERRMSKADQYRHVDEGTEDGDGNSRLAVPPVSGGSAHEAAPAGAVRSGSGLPAGRVRMFASRSVVSGTSQ